MSSCGTDYGNQVQGGNLTVFFNEVEDQEFAERIALYWKDNQLMTESKQDLQLFHTGAKFELRLIANDPSTTTQMPFDERKLLMDLQGELRTHLALQQLDLVICDNEFEPIYNINQ